MQNQPGGLNEPNAAGHAQGPRRLLRVPTGPASRERSATPRAPRSLEKSSRPAHELLDSISNAGATAVRCYNPAHRPRPEIPVQDTQLTRISNFI